MRCGAGGGCRLAERFPVMAGCCFTGTPVEKDPVFYVAVLRVYRSQKWRGDV